MALQKSTIYKDISIPNAYFKITNISYYKLDQTTDDLGNIVPANPFRLNISLAVRATKGGQEIDSRGYVMELDDTLSKPYNKQAYLYLKSLPEFSGASDA